MTYTGTKGNKEVITNYLFDKDDNQEFEIKPYKEKRSLLARYYNWTDEDMKIKMVLDYGALTDVVVKVPRGTDIKKFYPYAKFVEKDEENDCYLFYERTHNLNTHEMYKLLCGVVQECKDVGIPTKDDLELKRLIEMEKLKNENNRYKS